MSVQTKALKKPKLSKEEKRRLFRKNISRDK